MKSRALFVSKFKSGWEPFLLQKLSLCFTVDTFYLLPYISRYGMNLTIDYINRFVSQNQVKYLFLDVEYFPCVDISFVKSISHDVVLVMLLQDDLLMHDFNSITASADVVLSTDPLSVLKYQEKVFPPISSLVLRSLLSLLILYPRY